MNEVEQLNSEHDELINVELVYGTSDNQQLMMLSVKQGLTVEKVIEDSGILTMFEEIDLTVNKVGVWNHTVKLDYIVNDLDRIEVYRPLIADPKEVRKRRAEKAKEEGRADKVTGGRVNPLRGKNS